MAGENAEKDVEHRVAEVRGCDAGVFVQPAGEAGAGLARLGPADTKARAGTFAKADISRMADAPRITKGVDAIVHLGGYSVGGPWENILQANIVGCYNVFEAARRNGVKRILFATSNHAVGFYPRTQKIDHHVYIKPDGRDGVSKVFGEERGSLYSDK